MKIFVDWGRKKASQALFLEDGETSQESVEDLSSLSEGSEVYLEAGKGHKVLYELIEKDCNIYQCHGQDSSKFREELGRPKSDELDPRLLYLLWQERPETFKKLKKPKEREIKFKHLMSKYHTITNQIRKTKQIEDAYEKEFGESNSFDKLLKRLKSEKKNILNEAYDYIPERAIKYREKITGIGTALVCRLLSVKDPRDFPSLGKYLGYGGRKESAKYKYDNDGNRHKRSKYSRKLSGCARQMAVRVVMNQKSTNGKYYRFYKKVKEDKREKYPDKTPNGINEITYNKLSTFLLKEFWRTMNAQPNKGTKVEDYL